jgi:hypothetical protein
MSLANETKYRKAFEAAHKSVAFNSNIVEAQYLLASLSALLGEVDQAITSLETAIKANPMYCLVVDKDKDFDRIRAEVRQLQLRLTKEAKTVAENRFAAAREELASRKFVGKEQLELEKELRNQLTEVDHLIASGTYFDYRNALAPLGEAEALIEKQKDNESKRRDAQTEVEKKFAELFEASKRLEYEPGRELEEKRKIESLLAVAERSISQASLNDYRRAKNILNEVATLSRDQRLRQNTRAKIKKEAEGKIATTSTLLEECQRRLKAAEKLRRKSRTAEADPFPNLYNCFEDAREALSLSKTKLQQKDYWSIVDAKAFAEKAYGLTHSLIMNAESLQRRFDEYYASKKSDAKYKARSGASYGRGTGAVCGGIFMFLTLRANPQLNSLENLIIGIIAGVVVWGLLGWILGGIGGYIYSLAKRS